MNSALDVVNDDITKQIEKKFAHPSNDQVEHAPKQNL